ncbi:hypothetical protein QBC38DRAFT_491119 [Podospora fimiseda]|uniref:Secreted protein n=1 Tax=Podospora fimiseda TaxID=252190 RepID=A0AAN7BFR9_9PEZI|nr:hypothetical protein QBC38DRAFT_491119 [Podospora fimiseda]
MIAHSSQLTVLLLASIIPSINRNNCLLNSRIPLDVAGTFPFLELFSQRASAMAVILRSAGNPSVNLIFVPS